MNRKLIVFGGTGFLGKRLCQAAVCSNFQVISLSRSGKAPSSDPWAREVQWKSCDIFDASSYSSFLKDATDVVHSIGILLENESYKKQINGSFLSSLRIPPLKFGFNPLKQKPENDKFTYDMMNKYSATLLLDTFLKSSVNPNSFTYVSADKGFPMIPKGYINSKRLAEDYLMQHRDKVRPIILRPGFMFDEMKGGIDARSQVKNALQLLNCGNDLILRNQFSCVNGLVRPLISTQQVGRSLVHALEDDKIQGVMTLEDMLKV